MTDAIIQAVEKRAKVGKPRARTDEALMLHRQGTKIAALSAGAILSAAQADMRAKEYNIWLRAERRDYKKKGRDPKQLGFARSYAFLGKHVRKAATEAALIKLAIDKNADSTSSENINVRRIYDSAALRGAFELAGASQRKADEAAT